MKKYFLLLLFLSSVAFATQSGTVDLGPTIGGGGGGGSGTVTSVGTGSGLTGGPITTSGTISCDVASSSVSGCLSSTDWTTFNNKANTALSNLTSPTSLNQDLIFNEGTNAQILTANSSTGPTANLNMKTGDGTGQASGSFSIGAGNSDTQSGGVVEFSGGNVTTATANESNGGDVSIFGGNTASTNAFAEGGSIMLTAGNAPIATNSGAISLFDGNSAAGVDIGPNIGVNILDNAGIQGLLIFNTDRELDDAGGNPIINFTSTVNLFQNVIFSQTSAAVIQTVDNSAGPGSEPLTVKAGDDTSTSGIEGGGNLILEAGSTASSTNAGIGGNILMNAGNAAGSGGDAAGGGNVTIRAGSSTVPLSSGSVLLQDGNSLSSINVSPGGLTMTNDSGSQVFAASSAGGISLSASAIKWQDGSQGTSGQCLVSTDTNGSGSWTTCPGGGGGGANQTLSNLTSPTALNQDLIFAEAPPYAYINSQAGTGSTITTGVYIGTGDNSGSGGTGSITIEPGAATTGTSGNVQISGGTGGTVGIGTVNITDGANDASLFLNGDFQLSNTSGDLITSLNGAAQVDLTGQLYMSGSPTNPTLSGCGSGATVSPSASDGAGAITMGAAATACVLTFASPWASSGNVKPHCFANDETTALVIRAVPTSTQVTFNATFVSGDVVDYWCVGEF